jgi:hypothetical protein
VTLRARVELTNQHGHTLVWEWEVLDVVAYLDTVMMEIIERFGEPSLTASYEPGTRASDSTATR